jgi:hypothetical protein
VDALNGNLSLNGDAAPGVIPGLGEWAPENVPGTRAKKRLRRLIVLYLVLVVAVVSALMAWLWTMLR